MCLGVHSLAVLEKQRFRRRLSEFLCATALLVASSAAMAAPDQSARANVDIIKGIYYKKFPQLPKSRKCTPADAKGAWVEKKIIEEPGSREWEDLEKNGKKYLGFGEYNKVAWFRTKQPARASNVSAQVKKSAEQYIITTDGMFYIYENNSLKISRLCFVATEATKDIAKDLLMLAVPLERNKFLTLGIYEPLK